MPTVYDYQDVDIRFGGDLRLAAPGSSRPYTIDSDLARETEWFARQWWQQNAPVALRLNVYVTDEYVVFSAVSDVGIRPLQVPMRDLRRNMHGTVESALSRLLAPDLDSVAESYGTRRLPGMLFSVQLTGTIDVPQEPEPTPKNLKTFLEWVLDDEDN